MDQETNKVNSQENGQRRRPPVRYDENGNPIPPKKRPPVRYDENGNPIPPKKRPPVRYDENGNPIPPKKRPPVRYDENGNPIPPKKRPPVRYDENGNPIPPKKRPPVRYDENGNPIPPKKRPPVRYDEDGNPIPMPQRPARPASGGYERMQQNGDALLNREEHNQEVEAQMKKKNRNIFGKIMIGLQAVATVVFMVLIFMLDLLPTKYVLAVAGILLILWGFTFITQKFRSARAVGKVFSIFVSVILIAGTVYLWKAYDVMNELTEGQTHTVSHMAIVVMQDSPATGLQDLDGGIFGIQAMMDRDKTDETLAELNGQYGAAVLTMEYNGVLEQVQGLYNDEVDAIVLNDAYRSMILETYPTFESDTRVLDSFEYKEEIVEEVKKDVKVAEEPFTVYLAGNDAYGEVSMANGRNDVNILATVNPNTRQILLTTTPRDYYVELPYYEGCMDKLTHAGMGGMECSIETLENLYDIDVDYYVKVNFSGFQDIVDALDGVEVYSEYAFTTVGGIYYFDAGYNYVYGEEALGFVRERYAFSDGDVQRGKNQMAMIQAIIDKALSPSILANYMDLMDSVSDCFVTDMPRNKISDLIKMQLDEGGSWEIVTNSVTGYGNMRSTYFGGAEPLSVLDMDETSVKYAKELIQAVENGEKVSNP